MKNAAAHGADMVEFDVQLSQDLVPVVYHDFELLASIVNKKGDQQMMVQMPLKNLTLEQLREKLGKGGGSPMGGGGPVATNSTDFDGMLDTILG